MNVVKEIERINQRELELGLAGTPASWHSKYRASAYIYVGGLDYELSEGDVICVFSQFGEVVDCNLIRDEATGKSKGFAFLAFEDQRSTDIAVDNMAGFKVCGRPLRVDHVLKYRKPRRRDAEDEGGAWSEDSATYEERRRRIWDYEKFGTLDVSAVGGADAGAELVGRQRGKEDAVLGRTKQEGEREFVRKQKKRMLALMEARRKMFAQNRIDEEQQGMTFDRTMAFRDWAPAAFANPKPIKAVDEAGEALPAEEVKRELEGRLGALPEPEPEPEPERKKRHSRHHSRHHRRKRSRSRSHSRRHKRRRRSHSRSRSRGR